MKLEEMMGSKEKRAFKQRELEQELAGETDQPRPHARWVKIAGPEGMPGFDLQVETSNGWSSVGFIKTSDKPKTNSLVVSMYDGGKMIKVDLDAYDFFT